MLARIVAAAETHDANVARMVRLDGDVSDCAKVRFGGPVPHGAGRIHVLKHDSRLGPGVTAGNPLIAPYHANQGP